MNSFKNLTKLFKSGALPVVISDSDYVLNAFSLEGFDVCTLSNALSQRGDFKEVLLAVVDPSASPSSDIFDKTFANSSVLICPLMSFGADTKSIDYFISTLKNIDFEIACENGRNCLEKLQSQEGAITVSTLGKNLSVELGEDLEVFAPKVNPVIKPGEWISVSQFLEIALIPNKDYSCFNVNGEFVCEGVSVAFHRHNYEESGPLAHEAWGIFQKIRESKDFPITLSVIDSEVVSIKTNSNQEILELIKPLTDEVFHGKLIEVAFASLLPSKKTDWNINSQLNEAAGGVHLALGTGVKAAHIDFVCPTAIVEW
ncbi:MAG: hypothetical protein OIF51_07730 [Cellvibrionaceae bacterium]|nr:hypothetical protein [Cellvibrionaceae bacterium]